LTVVQTLKTEPGAKTMTLDPRRGKFIWRGKYEAPGENRRVRKKSVEHRAGEF